jgi:LPS sulfotransferase NodH
MRREGTSPARRIYGRLTRGAERFEANLVWVLGSPRSGSTWMLKLLESHPAVIPVNEPLIGWHLGPFMSDLPGGDASKLDSTNCTLSRTRSDDISSFFNEEFRSTWQPWLGRLMRERFYAHAQRYPAQVPASRARMLIKEPNGSQSSDLIMAALPRARMLFLLRDGRDIVDSDLAANLRGAWATRAFAGFEGIDTRDERLSFVTQSAYKWLWRTEATQAAYRDHPGPKHLVKYEDLRADPVPHLRAIVDWMGIEVDDAALEKMVADNAFESLPAEARGPQAFHRSASPGMWRENLSAEEQAAVEGAIGPKLRELGYEL